MKNHLIFGDEKNELDLSKHKNTCTTRLFELYPDN